MNTMTPLSLVSMLQIYAERNIRAQMLPCSFSTEQALCGAVKTFLQPKQRMQSVLFHNATVLQCAVRL